MDVTPRRRVLKSVLGNCLRRFRTTGDLPDDEFERENADFPTYLREAADSYELAPSELLVRELGGSSGYDVWSGSYDANTANPVILGENEALGDLPLRFPAERVLDAGAGTGRHAVAYARAGARVTAIEPSEGMLAQARQKAAAENLRIDFIHGDLDALRDVQGQFDVVVCCLVLSHVADLALAMTALAGRVAPGGRLILSDFHPSCLLVGMRTSFFEGDTKYFVPNALHMPSQYVRLATERGLAMVEFHETGILEGFPGLPATLSLVFRKT